MRIKQFVIMMMIICGCVSVGCKNKEVQESDKTASESSRLARQEVEYPEKEDTYGDWALVGEFKINSRSVEQDVHDTDTSYLYIMGFSCNFRKNKFNMLLRCNVKRFREQSRMNWIYFCIWNFQQVHTHGI